MYSSAFFTAEFCEQLFLRCTKGDVEMGRPRQYTPEEAEDRKNESNRISRKKYKEKIKSNPETMKTQIEANTRYLAKVPTEEKRKQWQASKQAQRERERMYKKIQLQAACEQAEEL